jgi:hypothetical protein
LGRAAKGAWAVDAADMGERACNAAKTRSSAKDAEL